jgi:hypothetical protein
LALGCPSFSRPPINARWNDFRTRNRK